MCKNTGACTVNSMPKAPLSIYASMYVLVCVFKIFSETTWPTEVKFPVEPQWDRGEENLFTGFRSFVVLHLNIVSLWGRGLFPGLLPQMWPRSAGLWKLKS